MKTNDYLNLGFSYETSLHSIKGNIVVKFTAYYHGEEIHFERVNKRTDCDKLFTRVSQAFLRNERINNLGI